MSSNRFERKLTAILAADVAGYSRLMGADEAGTAVALRERFAALDPVVAAHRGRGVKTAGDGILLEFSSIVDAVECALAMQKLMSERNAELTQECQIWFRAGVNLGDVLIDGDTFWARASISPRGSKASRSLEAHGFRTTSTG